MKLSVRPLAALALGALSSILCANVASADPLVFIENTDLPGCGTLPNLVLGEGENSISGFVFYTATSLDFDSFAFTVPADFQVTSARVVVLHRAGLYAFTDWRFATGPICGNGQLIQAVNCVFAPTPNTPTTTILSTPILPGEYNMTMGSFGANFNSLADWRFEFTVAPLNATGACCTGVTCAVVPVAQCTSGYAGNFTTCGPLTCCQMPIANPNTLPPISADCDGDLVADTCPSRPAAADCNANGAADSCETLVFTDDPFTPLGAVDFVPNGFATYNSGGNITLTDNAQGQGGSIVRSPLTTGPTKRLRAIFDFRIDSFGGVPADGFSFSLLDADAFGTNVLFAEEGIAAPDVLTVKFNTFENAPGEGNNSMFIRYSGADIAQNVSLPFTLADGGWHRCVIDLTPQGRITVRIGTNPGDMATIFNEVQIPGYTPKHHLIGFGARTGGFASLHQIDNVRIGVNGPSDANGNGVPDSCECRADFNGVDGVTIQDVFEFLNAWFASSPSADINSSGGVTIQDIFDFLNRWFAGC